MVQAQAFLQPVQGDIVRITHHYGQAQNVTDQVVEARRAGDPGLAAAVEDGLEAVALADQT